MVALVVVLTPTCAVDGNVAGIFTPFSHKVNGSGELCSNSVLTVICRLMAALTEVKGRRNSIWISIYELCMILSWNWAFKKDSSLKKRGQSWPNG